MRIQRASRFSADDAERSFALGERFAIDVVGEDGLPVDDDMIQLRQGEQDAVPGMAETTT